MQHGELKNKKTKKKTLKTKSNRKEKKIVNS